MPLIQIVVTPGTPPRTRADCIDGPRPCPFIGCRFHLANEAKWPSSSEPKVRELPPEHETCALDIADRGPHTLEEIAAVMGCTRERIRQIEERALAKLKAALKRRALERGGTLDDFAPLDGPPGEMWP